MKRTALSSLLKIGKQDAPVTPIKGIWMIPSYSNMGVIDTEDGLVLINVPLPAMMARAMALFRGVLKDPVNTIFLTHGHADHAVALDPLFEKA